MKNKKDLFDFKAIKKAVIFCSCFFDQCVCVKKPFEFNLPV